MVRVKLVITVALLCLVAQVRGAQEVVEEIFAGNQFAVGVNEETNQIYLAGMVAVDGSLVAGVSIYDGTTHQLICEVPLGLPAFKFPNRVGVNTVTNRVYVTTLGGAGSVSVVDAATCSVIRNIDLVEPETNLAILAAGGIAVNPTTNRIYATGGVFATAVPVVVVIDGGTNEVIKTIRTGASSLTNEVAINPSTNRVYVTNTDDDTVTVIDGSSDTAIAELSVSRPADIAVNPATNRVYVTSPRFEAGPETFRGISVFDGATNALLLAVPMASNTIAVDTDMNRLYIDGRVDGIRVHDAGTLALLETFSGMIFGNVLDLALNRVTRLAYVVTSDSRFYVIGRALEVDAGPEQAVLEGQGVTLAGSATGGLAPYAFSWTQTGGAPVPLSDPASPSPVFAAPDGPDTLTFSLTVTDARGRVAQDPVQVVVSNVAPTANAGPDQIVLTGDVVTLSGTGSDPVDPVEFSWNQKPEPFEPSVVLSCAGAVCTFTAPAGPAVLTFELTVTDDDNGVGTDEMKVTVRQNLDAEVSMVARPPLQSAGRGATNFRTMSVRVCNVGATPFTVDRAAQITLSITVNSNPVGGAISLRNPGSAALAPGACDRANFRWNYQNAGPAAGQVVTFGATLSTDFPQGADIDAANNVDARSLTVR